MKFQPQKYFKFKMLEGMEALVGKSIKALHEYEDILCNKCMVFLTEDNSLLAFHGGLSDYGYTDIGVMDESDIARTMHSGNVDNFYISNNLIDITAYQNDYKEYVIRKQNSEKEKQLENEYQQYLRLKDMFSSGSK
jgi:hypothetical protein